MPTLTRVFSEIAFSASASSNMGNGIFIIFVSKDMHQSNYGVPKIHPATFQQQQPLSCFEHPDIYFFDLDRKLKLQNLGLKTHPLTFPE